MNFIITEQPWGNINGDTISLYQITHSSGISVSISNYGAVIQAIFTKDKNDNIHDIVLGYDDLQGYLDDPFFMGCVVGRFANRIAHGKVTIEATGYQLSIKKGHSFHHHGGIEGFNKKVWKAHTFNKENSAGVILQYYSKDGEEGYPGNLLTTITYTLNDKGQLITDYYADTDQPTIINLTGHSYFNLSGDHSRSIEGHLLMLPLEQYLPVTDQYIPTGELLPVKGTSLDFTNYRAISPGNLNYGEGYDNTWIVADWKPTELKPVASIFDPHSGRILKVTTTEPSVHVYSGDYLSDEVKGKNGMGHRHHSGICFETQHYPDSPNHPHFPSTVIYPGSPYKSRTVYTFGVKDDQ